MLEHVRARTIASRMPLYFAMSGFFKSRPGIFERPVEFMQVKCFKVLRALPATLLHHHHPPPSKPPSPTDPPKEHTTDRGNTAYLSSRPPPRTFIPASILLSFTFLPALFLPIHFSSVLPPRPPPSSVFSPTSTIVHPLSFCDSGCLKQSVCLQGWMIDSRERARQLSGDR